MRPILLIALIALLLPPAFARADEPSSTTLHRPTIGLVLGGGGARGAAHVGVLKVLEALHIPIDFIAGTSFGAIVGGLYASGLSPEQIETMMDSVDWGDALRDASPRTDLTFRRKEDDRAYQVGASIGFHSDGMPALPRGLIEGQRLGFLLKQFALHASDTRDFNRLPIPFRAVAVDLNSGQTVVLDHGDLATTMRASMSIPGLISPVPWVDDDGTQRLLIDGGINDNLPIDVVRAMGADIVIAVNVGAPLYKADQLNSVVSVTDQVTTLVTLRNTGRQIATLGKQDVLVQPRLTGISSGSFDMVEQAVGYGAKAAQDKADQLVRLALTPEAFTQWRQEHLAPKTTVPDVDFIELDNRSDAPDAAIRARIHLPLGKPLDLQQLRADLDHIYGMELFEQVSFDLSRKGEQTGVVIHLVGKSWGPHYLRTGVTLQAASNGDNTYGLRFGLLSTGLNHWGAEWRNDVLLGTEHFVISEWYQPLDPEGVWFVAPRAEERRYPRGVFSGDQQTAKYQVRLERLALDLGTTLGGNAWEGRAGIVKEWVQQSLQVGPTGLNPTAIQQTALTAGVRLDTLDAPAFPREGQQGHVTFTLVPRALGAQSPYHKLSAALGQVFSWHEFTIYGLAQGETSLNSQTPVYDLATLGGLFHLSGYPQGGLSGQHALLGSLVAYQRLARFPSALGSGAFAGGSIETGSAWSGALRSNLNTWVMAGSVFVGTDTAAGPLTVALAYAGRNRWAGYLVVGQVF